MVILVGGIVSLVMELCAKIGATVKEE